MKDNIPPGLKSKEDVLNKHLEHEKSLHSGIRMNEDDTIYAAMEEYAKQFQPPSSTSVQVEGNKAVSSKMEHTEDYIANLYDKALDENTVEAWTEYDRAKRGKENKQLEGLAKEKHIDEIKNLIQKHTGTSWVTAEKAAYFLYDYFKAGFLAASSKGKEEESVNYLRRKYKQWCEETKRNGSVLVGGSIYEFFDWLEPTEHGKPDLFFPPITL